MTHMESTYRGHRVMGPGAPSAKGNPYMTAQFPSTCGKCGGRIEVGTRITKDPGDKGWHHEECPPIQRSWVDELNGNAERQAEPQEDQPGTKSASGVSHTPALPPVSPDAGGAVLAGWGEGLQNGVWTIDGPRGHRTFRIVTVQPDSQAEHGDGDATFRTKHKGKRVLELMTGSDNTRSYRGLAWYPSKIGKLWKFGTENEVLVRVFAKFVERGEVVEGYEVKFAAHCAKCNRLLTNPSSIDARYGPVCVKGGWDR